MSRGAATIPKVVPTQFAEDHICKRLQPEGMLSWVAQEAVVPDWDVPDPVTEQVAEGLHDET